MCQELVSLLSLVNGIEVVGEAADGIEAMRQIQRQSPNVVLIDLRKPRMGGVEVMRRAGSEARETQFVVLTTYDGDEEIHRASQAGAQAYLLRCTTVKEMVAAINTVHSGKSFVP